MKIQPVSSVGRTDNKVGKVHKSHEPQRKKNAFYNYKTMPVESIGYSLPKIDLPLKSTECAYTLPKTDYDDVLKDLIPPEAIIETLGTNPPKKKKVQKTLNVNTSAPLFNFEKIAAIELPSAVVTANPMPFELSDKKFKLDRYQKQAVDAFTQGATTIVTAPTGTGKTLIAEYGIEDTLKKGKKIIYLSPLKALSNEKFTKLSELFGNYEIPVLLGGRGELKSDSLTPNLLDSKNVGIITGDVVINPNADLVVMTTEVYHNMLTKGSSDDIDETFKDFDAVIYDEFHYLSDPDRGKVWEESVMFTPKHMKQMMLSATASNANTIAKWISNINPEKRVELINVPENERHVPLKEFVFGEDRDGHLTIKPTKNFVISYSKLLDENNLSDRQKLTIKELKDFYGFESYKDVLNYIDEAREDKSQDTYDSYKLKNKLIDDGWNKDKAESISMLLSDSTKTKFRDNVKLKFFKQARIKPLIDILKRENKLPALFFVFSKKKCQKFMENAMKRNGTLLTDEESKRVLDKVEEAEQKGIYLGKDFREKYLKALMMGYSVHHAGMLPAYKSLVEELARQGLIKVCFATETLIAGINMPFKTTVFTSLEKTDGKGRHILPVSTFKQGAGRAGRRGKDDIGNVIVMPESKADYRNYVDLTKSTDTSLKSRYNVSYNSLLSDKMINSFEENLERTFLAQQNPTEKEKVAKKAAAKHEILFNRDFISIDENGMYHTTTKGELAKQIFGINEILLSEIIHDSKYTKDLEPYDLIALLTVFADVKDDQPVIDYESEVVKKLEPAIALAKDIEKEQNAKGIYEEIKMSTNLVPGILKYATAPDDNETIDYWNQILDEMRESYLIKHEGDFLRVINSVLDLLKTIVEVSNDDELVQKAKDAIAMLKKPPVTDILKYELDI